MEPDEINCNDCPMHGDYCNYGAMENAVQYCEGINFNSFDNVEQFYDHMLGHLNQEDFNRRKINEKNKILQDKCDLKKKRRAETRDVVYLENHKIKEYQKTIARLKGQIHFRKTFAEAFSLTNEIMYNEKPPETKDEWAAAAQDEIKGYQEEIEKLKALKREKIKALKAKRRQDEQNKTSRKN